MTRLDHMKWSPVKNCDTGGNDAECVEVGGELDMSRRVLSS